MRQAVKWVRLMDTLKKAFCCFIILTTAVNVIKHFSLSLMIGRKLVCC